MDKSLLQIIVCPVCHGKLDYIKNTQQLLCQFDRLAYPIDDDIPVLLVERATTLTAEQVKQLL
ncbi:MAG: Trm112 family protein [Kangiellaceae bacterium]|nr:Trm112 family protein [Kangiellaceae bacterium]